MDPAELEVKGEHSAIPPERPMLQSDCNVPNSLPGGPDFMSFGECYELRCKCQTCGQVQDCEISNLTSGRAVCRGLISPAGIPQPCTGKLQPSEEPQHINYNALALLSYAISSAGFLDAGQKHTLFQRLQELETSVGSPESAQALRTIAEDLVKVMARPS